MKKPLLDVIFASDKRKDALLLLQDGAKEMEYLLTSLKTNRQSLLPQMRILEDSFLVSHYEDTYELTTIGKVIVDEMVPVLDITDVLDVDVEYWGTHTLDFIPPHLLKRIDELDSCTVINPSLAEMYEVDKSFEETCRASKYVCGVTTVFHPNFTDVYTRLTNSGTIVSTVLSEDLVEKLKANNYDEFKDLVESGKVNFYVYSRPARMIFFSLNDHCIFFSLLKVGGEFDHKNIVCHSKRALNWGKELFEYYLRDSVPLTEI